MTATESATDAAPRQPSAPPPGAKALVNEAPPGQLPGQYTPGDIGVVRDWKEDTLGQLIEAGERARYGHTAWANLTHSFLITSEAGEIVEANEPGIQISNIEGYRHADLYVIHPGTATQEQRDLAVSFAKDQVGAKYDVLDFVGLAFQSVFGWDLSLHSDRRFICSGLVSRATEKYIVAYPLSSEAMMPADLAAFWGLRMDEAPVPLGFFARFLDKIRALGRLIAGLFVHRKISRTRSAGASPQS